MFYITDEHILKYTPFQIEKLRKHQPIWNKCPECQNTFDAQSYIFRPTAIHPRVNEFCSIGCRQQGAGRKTKPCLNHTYVIIAIPNYN